MLYKSVTEAGHEIVLVGGPPGIESSEDRKYFACADVAILSLIQGCGQIYAGRSSRVQTHVLILIKDLNQVLVE